MPVNAMVSGEAGASGAGAGASDQQEDELNIILVKLVEEVLLAATVGDDVHLRLDQGNYEAYIGSERVGSVPVHYSEDLEPRSSYRGRLSKKSIDPLTAVVRVRIRS